MDSESGFAPVHPPAPHGPGARSRRPFAGMLDELQWVLFRLFGIHSSVHWPGDADPAPPWGWHRPLICHALHQLTAPDGSRPVQERCRKSAAELTSAAGRRPAGRCAAGLSWKALRIPIHGDTGFTLIVGPYVAAGDRPRRAVGRLLAGPESAARANPRDLEEGLTRTTALSPVTERRMLAWCRATFTAAARNRSARLPDAVWGSLASPLRYTGPAACSLYGIYVERIEGPPRPPTPGGLRQNGGELYVLEEGTLNVTRPGRSARIAPGQGIFRLPDTDVAFAPSGTGRVGGTTIMVVGELESFRPLTGRTLVFTPAQRSALEDLWASGLQAADELAQASQRAKFLDLLLSLLPSRPAEPDAAGREPLYRRHHDLLLVARVKERLWAAAERPVTRTELAQAFHRSAAHLNGIFRRHTGVPLLKYHRSLRMARARSLLRGGRLNVGQVAARLGFSTIFHFSAEFKRATGRSPRAYSRTARF